MTNFMMSVIKRREVKKCATKTKAMRRQRVKRSVVIVIKE